jgi:hypothetical protein
MFFFKKNFSTEWEAGLRAIGEFLFFFFFDSSCQVVHGEEGAQESILTSPSVETLFFFLAAAGRRTLQSEKMYLPCPSLFDVFTSDSRKGSHPTNHL